MNEKQNNKKVDKEYGNEALSSGYSIKEGKETNRYPNKESYEAAKKKFQENPDATKRYEFNAPTGKEGEIKRTKFYSGYGGGLGLSDKDMKEIDDYLAAVERNKAREKARDPLGIAKSHNLDQKMKDMSWDKRNTQFGQFVDMLNTSDKYRDSLKVKPGQDVSEEDWHVTTTDQNQEKRSDLYDLFKQELKSGRFNTDQKKFIDRNPGTPDNVQEVENKNRDTIKGEYRQILDEINKQLSGPYSRDDLLTPEQKDVKNKLQTQAISLYQALKEKDPLNEEKIINKDVKESEGAGETIEYKHEQYNKILNKALHSDISPKLRAYFNKLISLDPKQLDVELNKNVKARAMLDKIRQKGAN